jgi:hypothetical protein
MSLGTPKVVEGAEDEGIDDSDAEGDGHMVNSIKEPQRNEWRRG